MTVLAPPALAIEPRTDAGTGITVPIAKALSHLMLVHEASAREWPLTNEAAAAEVNEAVTHLRDIVIPRDLLTEDTAAGIAEWMDTLHPFGEDIRRDTSPIPDELFHTNAQRENLQAIVRQTWALLAVVDREITGVTGADPGSRP